MTRSDAALRLHLDSARREAFRATGALHLPGLIPRADAAAMADRLWQALERQHGLLRGRPETWTLERPAQLGDLRRAGVFAAMRSAGVEALLDEAFGPGGWQAPARWGGPLVTFPQTGAWVLPHASWHLDILPGQPLSPWPDRVRLFAILAPLQPEGGGTLYLAGSHLLAMPSSGPKARSAAILEALKRRSAWIADLCAPGGGADRTARFMEAGTRVDGVDLKVGEMTGEAGDVWMMHPGVLHTVSPNVRAAPRLMLQETVAAAG